VRDGYLRLVAEMVIHLHGAGADPQVASYAFAVLCRHLQRGRAAHTRRIRKRVSKDRRGEEFAQGFVAALCHLFPRAELPEGRQQALDAAIKHAHGNVGTTSGKEIKQGRASENDHWPGWEAGRRAQVNHGLAEARKKLEASR
jgi:hypothetical protein